jgi:methylglyoxal synthase
VKIILLADSRKNELLVNFCIAYSNILSRHNVSSLQSMAKLLSGAANLDVAGLPADIAGGMDQLASRAMYNEVDAVIYLRDPLLGDYNAPNPLMKACDINSIPYATNIATAELLVLAIDRGDLDWRELIR